MHRVGEEGIMGSEATTIQQEIDRRFRYHEGTDDQCEDCIKVRASMQAAAHRVAAIAPDCRERELAITHLEQALSWAIAAIVRPSQGGADGVA